MPMFERARISGDFSRAAPVYAAYAALQAKIGAALIRHASPFLPAGGLLLDVGAGTGDVTQQWPMRAIALDAAFGMCREAMKKRLPVVHATAEQLPVRDTAVDAVASNLMLQWITQPERFFAESFRVIKPEGVLAISTFTEGTLDELSNAFAAAGEMHRTSDFTAPQTLTRSIRNNGFEIVSEQHETRVEFYDDVLDLCLSLRDIGAHNKRIDRPRGLLTLRKLREVAGYYGKTAQGIPARWEVHMVVARKKI
ncbi:MAG: methyltransferase domain-containing protein [Alphaproteobacteria bacterium]|nr:methyltransferase domain-containing protein [Alphaproteobacteria bacterium]